MTAMHPRNFCIIEWKTSETTFTSNLWSRIIGWKPPSQAHLPASRGGSHQGTVQRSLLKYERQSWSTTIPLSSAFLNHMPSSERT